MVPIGGGSTKSVLSDRLIVYTKSRKQLLHRKYLLYYTGCTSSISLFEAWSFLQQVENVVTDQLNKYTLYSQI